MSRTQLVYGEPAFRTAHANPYNAALYTEMMRQGDVVVRDLHYIGLAIRAPRVVHLHWPELTFLSGHRKWRVTARLILFFGFLAIARGRGTRLVWTAHNIRAHEERSTPRLRRWYRRLLTKNVDEVIVLSSSSIAPLHAEYPELADTPVHVIPHGHYRDLYDFGVTRAEARAALGVDEAAVLVVSAGQIRPYKNVPALIRAFVDLAPDRALLGVAGRVADPALRDEITAGLARLPDSVSELGHLDDERLAIWLRAADVAVLPYAAIENSGSAILALSAGRPVVVPRIGAMGELREQIGDDWVFTYDGDFTAETLEAALRWVRDTPRDPDGPDLGPLDWAGIAAATRRVFLRL